MNAANQAVLELEPEAVKSVLHPIGVTREGNTLNVVAADRQHGFYCEGDEVRWEIEGLQSNDLVVIMLQRDGYSFSLNGRIIPGPLPQIEITLPDQPLPDRETWDKDHPLDPARDSMLVPYTLTLTTLTGEQLSLPSLNTLGAPGPLDPCLVIDRMGDPPPPPPPAGSAEGGE